MKHFERDLFFLCAFTLLSTTSSAKDMILTCPHSGEGSPQIQLTLTAKGGFELPTDQTMYLPLQFDQAKMDNADPQKGNGVKLSCIYNSYTEKGTAQKTVTLVAYASPGATNCKITKSKKDGKPNQLVCTMGGGKP